MLSLNTHIPIEYIQKDKKLQEIKINDAKYLYWSNVYWSNHGDGDGEYIPDKAFHLLEEKPKPYPRADIYKQGIKEWYKRVEIYPAPTIADIIDNAEMLTKSKEMSYYFTANIIGRCQDDKSIEEISEYIIKSLKEK